MINEISLKNFKGFKNLDQLKFKPVTILCGVNSSGKSSILQSILLAKQTVESQNPNQTLLLNGRFVHLGTFENIIFSKNPNKPVSLNFSFNTMTGEGRERVPLPFLLRGFLPQVNRDQQIASINIKYKISLMIADKENGLHTVRNPVVSQYSFDVRAETMKGKTIQGASVELNLVEDSTFNYIWRNLGTFDLEFDDESTTEETYSGEDLVVCHFGNLSPRMLRPKKEIEEEDTPKRFPDFFWIHFIREILRTIFSTYTYLGPLREEPSRRYIYEDEVVEIGIKGENAAYIYQRDQNKRIFNHSFYNKNQETFKKIKITTLSNAVHEWMSAMGIKDFQPEPLQEIIYLNLDSSMTTDTRVNIADVGFGVSQIFPIILEGLRMPESNTLLLEQPEIHLHPNLQMQMADFFLSLALSDKSVIVETHSDHIVNRLVRRIVEDENNQYRDLIGIYFFKPTKEGAVFEEIEIDENRGIINWPDDFFDQTASEQEKIILAGLEKRRKTRETNSGGI